MRHPRKAESPRPRSLAALTRSGTSARKVQNLIRKRLPGAPGPAGKPSPHGQVGRAQERGGDHGSMPLPARLPGASGWCPSQGWLEGQAPLALQPLVPCAKVREVSWGRSRSQQCPREGQGYCTPGPGSQAVQVSVHGSVLWSSPRRCWCLVAALQTRVAHVTEPSAHVTEPRATREPGRGSSDMCLGPRGTVWPRGTHERCPSRECC